LNLEPLGWKEDSNRYIIWFKKKKLLYMKDFYNMNHCAGTVKKNLIFFPYWHCIADALNPFVTFNSFRVFNACRFGPKLQTKHVLGWTWTHLPHLIRFAWLMLADLDPNWRLGLCKNQTHTQKWPPNLSYAILFYRATNTQLAGFVILRTTSQLIIFSSMGSWIHTQWPLLHFFRTFIHTCNIIVLWW
jgi:hypothetical protein